MREPQNCPARAHRKQAFVLAPVSQSEGHAAKKLLPCMFLGGKYVKDGMGQQRSLIVLSIRAALKYNNNLSFQEGCQVARGLDSKRVVNREAGTVSDGMLCCSSPVAAAAAWWDTGDEQYPSWSYTSNEIYHPLYPAPPPPNDAGLLLSTELGEDCKSNDGGLSTDEGEPSEPLRPVEAEELGSHMDEEPSPAATPVELHNGEEQLSQQISQPPVSPSSVPVSGEDESGLESVRALSGVAVCRRLSVFSRWCWAYTSRFIPLQPSLTS